MGGLVFMAPGTEATRHTEGHPLLAIELGAGVFEAEVLRLHESGCNVWPCVPQALDLSDPRKLALIEAINGLVNAHATGPAAPSPTHGGCDQPGVHTPRALFERLSLRLRRITIADTFAQSTVGPEAKRRSVPRHRWRRVVTVPSEVEGRPHGRVGRWISHP
jgi:hypothetical protein